jgi:hypothetical protein
MEDSGIQMTLGGGDRAQSGFERLKTTFILQCSADKIPTLEGVEDPSVRLLASARSWRLLSSSFKSRSVTRLDF